MSSTGLRQLGLGPKGVVRKNWKRAKARNQICNRKLQVLLKKQLISHSKEIMQVREFIKFL